MSMASSAARSNILLPDYRRALLILQFSLFVAIVPFTGALQQTSCNTAAVDKCLTGVLFSAQDNRSFFRKNVSDVEQLCMTIPRIPGCVQNATGDCPSGAKRFLKALMKGYDTLLQSKICANGTDGLERRKQFATSSRCLSENFDNGCMKNYIKALDRTVALPNSVDKIRKACCLHRSYRVCLADQVTPLCGVEAASGYIQFNSMLSAAPIREICGVAYAEDACKDVIEDHDESPEASNTTTLSGTILSRLLKILADTTHVEQPTIDFDLDEALEYTSCTPASIDECFQGVLSTGQADSAKPWAASSVAQLDGFCDRLAQVPRCLRSRTAMCHTSTNEFFKLVKEEVELTTRSTLCQHNVQRDFFIESGKCIRERVSNLCNTQLTRALQAAAKAPPSEARRKLLCCLTSRYSRCLIDEIKPLCGPAAAEYFSSLLQRLSLPGLASCECELDVADKPVPEGTIMAMFVEMLEDL